MPDKIIHIRSLTPGSVPTTSSLGVGELAINVNDGKIFVRQSGSLGDTIQSAVTTNNLTSGSIRLSGSLQVTGSVNTPNITGSLFGTSSWASNSISSSQAVSSSFASTASFAPAYLPLTGGTITGNLTVIGTASIQYVSESTLNIGTNIITVNTFNPTSRFGGLSIIDSGSSPQVSASFLYDSIQDEFIFVHRGTSTSAITSSHFLIGPETYNNLGDEIYLTANRIPKSKGNEHLNDSNISDDGSVVSINSNTQVTGSLIVTQGITSSLAGTSSFAISSSVAVSSSFAVSASWAPPSTINAGGSNTQIQFNSASAFAGTGSFTFNYTSQSLQQGSSVIASGIFSHAEGGSTQAIGNYSHAEGNTTQTGITTAFEAKQAISSGLISLINGYGDVSPYFTPGGYLYIYDTEFGNDIGWASYLIDTVNGGTPTTIQLVDTSVNTSGIVRVGDLTYLQDNGTFGGNATIPGPYSHAEGVQTKAIGDYSHAEGDQSQALGGSSHSEGELTQAIGNSSHAEGYRTKAIGTYSHAEGSETQAIGEGSHAEGQSTRVLGNYSHAEGVSTIASGDYQHVQGQYNITSSEQSAFIIGNGADDNNRSNLLYAAGNIVQITGSLRVSGSITGSLFGTSSFAQTASFAPNYVLTSATSSMTVLSASFAQTASFLTSNVNIETIDGLSILGSGSLPYIDNLFFSQRLGYLIPNPNATTYTGLRSGGTLTQTGQGSTSAIPSRVEYATAAASGSLAFQRGTQGGLFGFASANQIWYKRKFQITANISSSRFVCGLSNQFQLSNPTNVEPNTIINIIGVCKSSGSNNLQFIYNDGSGIATTSDLGSNYPANNVDGYVYELEISKPASSSDVSLLLRRIDSNGNKITTTETTNTNYNTSVGLSSVIYGTNNTTASAFSFNDFGLVFKNYEPQWDIL